MNSGTLALFASVIEAFVGNAILQHTDNGWCFHDEPVRLA